MTKLWTASTYLDYIAGAEDSMEALLQAMLVFRFAPELPPEFRRLEGRLAQLHLNRLAIVARDEHPLLLAIASKGVRLPGGMMTFRIARPWHAVIELAEVGELIFPSNWLDALELDGESVISYPPYG